MPASPKPGCHDSVPPLCEAFAVNTALWPAGSPLRSAASDVIAWPSGSLADTSSVNGRPSAFVIEAGAETIGGRSTFETVTAVLANPDCAFVAVNDTV